jgi:lipopolysaccharide transport system ATP-binding protein
MSTPAIHVERLSKRFLLGERAPYRRFSELLVSAFGSRNATGKAGRDATADHIWALKDVSFDVARGEVLGIIGRNGAGKSTLLKILSRITDPTEGCAKIRGRVGSLLEVGTGFHPELTGRENVFLNGAILGMRRSEIERKFDEIVAFAEVETFLDTPVKHYSSGMYTRLAFAVAAHLEPEILIIDEVLAVGDALFQKKCLGKMGDVAGHGRTILFVSHNMAAVRHICQRAILLEHGSIAVDGGVDEVIDRYLGGDESGESTSVAWEPATAPGDANMQLKSIRIRQTDSAETTALEVEKPIEIEVEYVVQRRLHGMRIVLKVAVADGTIAFTSTDHLEREAVTEPGVYRSVCTVPAGLLNVGKYLVWINTGTPGRQEYVKGAFWLSFHTVRSTHHGSLYDQKWPGVVAPQLAWKLRRIDGP